MSGELEAAVSAAVADAIRQLVLPRLESIERELKQLGPRVDTTAWETDSASLYSNPRTKSFRGSFHSRRLVKHTESDNSLNRSSFVRDINAKGLGTPPVQLAKESLALQNAIHTLSNDLNVEGSPRSEAELRHSQELESMKKEQPEESPSTSVRTLKTEPSYTHSIGQLRAFRFHTATHWFAEPHRPESTARRTFDFLYCLVMAITVLFAAMPLLVPDYTISLARILWDVFSTLFFALFISMNFLTSKLTRAGDLLETLDQIRHSYYRTWLAFDVIVAVPWHLFVLAAGGLSPSVSGVYVLRVIGVARIPYLFQQTNPLLERSSKLTYSLFCIMLFFFTHFLSVMWVSLRPYDSSRSARVYGGSDFYYVYVTAQYWVLQTLLTVGYGDLVAVTPNERMYSVVVMLIGSVITLGLSASLSALLVNDPYKVLVAERKRKLASLMSNHKIPWEVQKLAFGIYPALIEASIHDYSDVLEELPASLQEAIATHIKRKLIQSVPLFQKVSNDLLTHIASLMKHEVFGPNSYVVQSGERGESMYFLAHGVVEVLIRTPGTSDEVWACNLKDGSWFGEMALINGMQRTASIRTVTTCDVFRLDKVEFDEILKFEPELAKHLRQEMNKRMESNQERLTEFKVRSRSTQLQDLTVVSPRRSGDASSVQRWQNLRNQLSQHREDDLVVRGTINDMALQQMQGDADKLNGLSLLSHDPAQSQSHRSLRSAEGLPSIRDRVANLQIPLKKSEDDALSDVDDDSAAPYLLQYDPFDPVQPRQGTPMNPIAAGPARRGSQQVPQHIIQAAEHKVHTLRDSNPSGNTLIVPERRRAVSFKMDSKADAAT